MKPLKYLVIIFFFLCTAFIAFYGKATEVSAPKVTLITKEIPLAKYEMGISIIFREAVSPNNKQIAQIQWEASSGGQVVINGVPGKKYDYFSRLGCAFSPDGKHLAYLAGIKDKKYFMVLDGVEGPAGYTSLGYPTFSSDGRQFAYKAWDNNARKELVFLNWEKVGEYDMIAGMISGEYLVFSRDGKQLGFIAKNNKKEFAVVDGKEGKYYDFVGGFMFSRDSQHVMYIARRENIRVIVRDNVEIAESNSLESAVFSPDLSRIACIYKQADKKYVVVDENRGKLYDEITEIKFSPDGKRYAYAAWTDAGSDRYMCVVLDGKEQKNYRWVMNITFSPDSKRLAYIAGLIGGLNQCVVVDGIEGKNILQVLEKNYNISPPVFSPDSKHYGYVVEMGNEAWMVIDGIEGRHYNTIRKETTDGWYCKWDKSFTFGPDGKIAYWAKKGSEWLVVVDGVESKGYQGYIGDSKILFEGPNLLSFVAFRDNQIFRVELEIKQQ